MSILDQVRALESGKGVQYLINAAYVMFNGPVYVVDSYYNLIAASKGPEDNPIWADLIKTGTVNSAVKRALTASSVVGLYPDMEKPVYLKRREGWTGGVMTMRLMNRDRDWVGQITMYDFAAPFSDEAVEAFGILAEKVSREIWDYDYFANMPLVFFSEMVNTLLGGDELATMESYPQAHFTRIRHEAYLYVAVMRDGYKDILDSVRNDRLGYFSSLLKTMYPSYSYAVYDGYIVMLTSSSHPKHKDALLFEQNKSLFDINGLYAGISESFDDIYDMRQYYTQALDALRKGMEGDSGERVFYGNS